MKNMFLTFIVLGLSTWLALFIGGNVFPLLGTTISAIFIGFFIRHIPLYEKLHKATISFISSYALKTAIILLGFTLSARIIKEIGWIILAMMIAVVLVSILVSVLVNKWVKADQKLSLLIGIGTSICGGSAIAASGPIIEAEDEDVAVAMTTMFVFSMTALILLPVIGQIFNFSDQAYGIVAGLSVNDTSSVLATAFSWSDDAGNTATVVKMARTLFIVPMTIGLIVLKLRKQRKHSTKPLSEKSRINWSHIKRVVPVFVILFSFAFIFASIVPIPDQVNSLISQISKLIMTFALVSIGLGVHVKQIKKAGMKPIIIGASCSFSVTCMSIASMMMFY